MKGSLPQMIYIRTCSEGWEQKPEHEHSVGEYSIEAVIQKQKLT
jgi:hypothetical protein